MRIICSCIFNLWYGCVYHRCYVSNLTPSFKLAKRSLASKRSPRPPHLLLPFRRDSHLMWREGALYRIERGFSCKKGSFACFINHVSRSLRRVTGSESSKGTGLLRDSWLHIKWRLRQYHGRQDKGSDRVRPIWLFFVSADTDYRLNRYARYIWFNRLSAIYNIISADTTNICR